MYRVICWVEWLLVRGTCAVMGHGPFVDGWLAGRHGRFCQQCETFWERR